MANLDEYQPRTAERLVEILYAQSINPRSWQFEAAIEIERLLAALAEAAVYMSVCPPPDEAGGQLRSALQERRSRVLIVANQQQPNKIG